MKYFALRAMGVDSVENNNRLRSLRNLVLVPGCVLSLTWLGCRGTREVVMTNPSSPLHIASENQLATNVGKRVKIRAVALRTKGSTDVGVYWPNVGALRLSPDTSY